MCFPCADWPDRIILGIKYFRRDGVNLPPPAAPFYAMKATPMQKPAKPKQKCKNCEGKGLLKNGDKVVRCKRCNGTGVKQ
jgi:hypothetical protein